MSKNTMFWKLLAVSAVAIYIYKVRKDNGGSLQGLPDGMRINPDKLANLAAQFVPPEYRGHAKQFGSAMISRLMN